MKGAGRPDLRLHLVGQKPALTGRERATLTDDDERAPEGGVGELWPTRIVHQLQHRTTQRLRPPDLRAVAGLREYARDELDLALGVEERLGRRLRDRMPASSSTRCSSVGPCGTLSAARAANAPKSTRVSTLSGATVARIRLEPRKQGRMPCSSHSGSVPSWRLVGL